MTDQGSQFRSSRTAVIGTPSAAEKARQAGPARSTHQFMNTLSQRVIGTTHSAGYAMSQLAAPGGSTRASIATTTPAWSQSRRRRTASRRGLSGPTVTAPYRRRRVGAGAVLLLLGEGRDDARRRHHADRFAAAHHGDAFAVPGEPRKQILDRQVRVLARHPRLDRLRRVEHVRGLEDPGPSVRPR